MAREHNHGNKQGLKPLPISISSLWDSSLQRCFLYANMRTVDRVEPIGYITTRLQR